MVSNPSQQRTPRQSYLGRSYLETDMDRRKAVADEELFASYQINPSQIYAK